MSLSATIAVSPTTVQINQKTTASVTFTNGATDPARTIVAMHPYSILTGNSQPNPVSAAYGIPNTQSTNPSTTVPASGGTSVITFDITYFAPSTGLLSAGNGTYDVGCQCQSADGQYFHPTAATITVNQITFSSTEN